MTVLNVVQAVNHELREEMTRNDKVIVIGEDVGIDGGVFRATEGLIREFGPNRVIDTPLSETGIIGVSIGMALYGLRPVSEIQFMDFIYPGLTKSKASFLSSDTDPAANSQLPSWSELLTGAVLGAAITTLKALRPSSPTRPGSKL